MPRLPPSVGLAAVALVLVLGVSPAAAHAAKDPFAAGCPKEALEEGAAAHLNHNPAAKKAIVPAGATSLRICRYWGFGDESGRQTPKTQARAGALNDQAEIHNRPLLEGITDEFKELEAVPNGTFHCPEDDGSQLYAVFYYRGADPVILHVELSGCEFVTGAMPRARWLSGSLHKKLIRLAKGERVKSAPKHGEVKEKNAVEYPPPHITIAFARHEAKESLAEDCEGLCASWKVVSCERRTAAAATCQVEATLASGKVCRTGFLVKRLEEGTIEQSSGGTGVGPCANVFLPPELREQIERDEREEAQEEAEEGKRSSRATGQSPRRT